MHGFKFLTCLGRILLLGLLFKTFLKNNVEQPKQRGFKCGNKLESKDQCYILR